MGRDTPLLKEEEVVVYGSMTCDTPMFEVIDREMIDDGRFCESRSMGELLLEDEPSCRNAEC